MAFWRRLCRRILAVLQPGAAERELDRELRSHVALIEEDLEGQGVSPAEARRLARVAAGGIDQAKEGHRDARSILWLDDLGRDVRYALRGLIRQPGFAVAAVLALALGIGANTAIFSVVNAVLLRPLPYPHSDRVVRLLMNLPASQSPTNAPLRFPLSLTPAEVSAFHAGTTAFSHVAAATPALMGLSGHEEAARLNAARVSSTLFALLEVSPIVGRTFGPADEQPGAEPVVVMSATAWARYFGRSTAVVGKTVSLYSALGPRRETSYTVVGVLHDVPFPVPQTQFWIPVAPAGPSGNPIRGQLVGRLREGVSFEAAAAQATAIARTVREGQRGNDAAVYELVREQDELVAPIRPALAVLFATVGLILLLACANVANLLIARVTTRQQEMGIRASIGASRGRLVRQALTESMLLSLAGGAVGVGLALGGLALLRSLAVTLVRFDLASEVALPRLEEVSVDGTVLGFTLVVSGLAGVLFGLLPAIRMTAEGTGRSLRETGGASPSGLARIAALRNVLVVVEVGLAMVVLVGGALLVRSFLALAATDPGYASARVLTFQVALPASRYPDARLTPFAEELSERLRSVRGVEVAGYANQLPLVKLRDTAGGLWTTPDSRRSPPPASAPDARFVSHDYLSAMGVRIVAGRGFEPRDGAGSPRVLVINETLARQRFPGGNPVGQLVYVGRDVTPWEIVGVAADVRQFGLSEAPEAQFFLDIRQVQAGMPLFPAGAYYVVRSASDPLAVVPEVRRVVREMEGDASLFNIAPMAQVVTSSIARPRMYAVLLGVFAAIGVTLAALGVYGVMAFTVAQRTREIGIRVALGARRSSIMAMVLWQSLGLTVAGIVIGIVGAAGATRYLESMLFGLSPRDAATFGAAAGLILLVAALASAIPVLRATSVNPLAALRTE